MSAFMLLNLTLVLNFILSFFGVGNWAYASIILSVGVLISTLLGLYRHSDSIIKSKSLRILFSFSMVALAFPAYKLGELLNQNVYDGLITVVVLFYVISISILLNFLSKNQIYKKEYLIGKYKLII